MIEKVLIAEDHETANISVQATMEDLQITATDHVFYCDDAIAKLKHASKMQRPYDLLITDLHFEEDANVQQINSGQALITAARKIQPDLKVLVFSAENKPAVIEMLYNKLDIDGYVQKARNDAKELKLAIESISRHQRYYPRHLRQLIQQKNTHDFTTHDTLIIKLLSQGMLQKEIPDYLKRHKIEPASLSSLEKRLNIMKTALNFSKNEQLVAFCKDMGII